VVEVVGTEVGRVAAEVAPLEVGEQLAALSEEEPDLVGPEGGLRFCRSLGKRSNSTRLGDHKQDTQSLLSPQKETQDNIRRNLNLCLAEPMCCN
jgi:hypothetical protein